jgi:nucleotide-binding universal stress UspA family protein
MFRSVVVPLDGSAFSEQVLPLAEIVGRVSGTEVHLVHVQTSGASEAANRDPERSDKARYLSRLVDQLKDKGMQADQQMLEGEVVDALEGWAREIGADLIVMATHGRAGLKRLRLGSVAESLVSRSLAPILLLHPGDSPAFGPLDKVVVALDGSSFAQSIFAPLQSFGVAAGVKSYTLVHVADNSGVGKAGWAPMTTVQSRAEEWLDGFRSRLAGTDARIEVRVVRASEPSEGILETARKVGAGVIALTTHGMTGIRPTLLGSVAAKILHSWEGPLLLQRPQDVAA